MLFRFFSIVMAVAAVGSVIGTAASVQADRPNILLITADDLNWDSPGCFGGTTPDVTPNIDRLAREGMRFWHAHVSIAVCTPSRSVMLTGCYPQRCGVEGFQPIRASMPTLPAVLAQAGYLCGTVGKPLGQQETFHWSVTYRSPLVGGEGRPGRDPGVYRKFAGAFFEMAKQAQQPFFLMASSHDPHRPFASSEREKKYLKSKRFDGVSPSRVYSAEEVEVPGFLPSLPEIRREVAQYYSSVRRLDDTVGAILQALRDSGLEKNTLVIFMSDHGMAFPFAKTNCYMHSTRTPLIVRWPDRLQPGAQDKQHMIAGIDLMPTILEVTGVEEPAGMDGRSFLPLLLGQNQSGRDKVFTQFNHIHGRHPYPMRCVQTKNFIYIFNPWSQLRQTVGQQLQQESPRAYRAEPLSGLTYAAMKQAAPVNPEIAARCRMLQYRIVEEFYDLKQDPNCLENVIDESRYSTEVDQLRDDLRLWMQQVDDSALKALDQRHSPEALEKFMQEYLTRVACEIEALKEYEEKTGYHF